MDERQSWFHLWLKHIVRHEKSVKEQFYFKCTVVRNLIEQICFITHKILIERPLLHNAEDTKSWLKFKSIRSFKRQSKSICACASITTEQHTIFVRTFQVTFIELTSRAKNMEDLLTQLYISTAKRQSSLYASGKVAESYSCLLLPTFCFIIFVSKAKRMLAAISSSTG
jgi:hypothetical protein